MTLTYKMTLLVNKELWDMAFAVNQELKKCFIISSPGIFVTWAPSRDKNLKLATGYTWKEDSH